MGKHLRRKHTGIGLEDNHPGCLWGVLQVLDYHHWRHVKKMLPHRRHGSERHALGDDMSVRNVGKMQEHVDAEMDHCFTEGKKMESIRATKSSVKARIKALIAEEMSKMKGQHHRNLTFPARSQLMRTDSIHHLELSKQDPLAEIVFSVETPRYALQDNENSHATCSLDHLPLKASEEPVTSKKKCEVCDTMLTVNHLGHNHIDDADGKQIVENHTLLQEKLDKAKQALLEQKLTYATEHTRDAPLYQSKEFLDALDMINLNKELFLKIIKDQGSPLAHHSHGQQAFSTKMRLTKWESFPIACLSGARASRPSKFKHKLKEIGSHTKGERKSVEFESAENISPLSMPLMAENRVNGDSKQPEISDDASPGSPIQMKSGSENQVVIKRFKDLKQRLNHAIRESRKEKHRITMDAVLHKVPYGRKFSKDVKKEIAGLWKEHAMDRGGKDSPASSYESDHSGPVLSKGRLHSIIRTSSLSLSLDRYCQLYESNFNREAKYHISERVKLRTEKADSPGRSVPKSMGRVHSLPDLKSYFYLPSDDSYDALSSGTPIRTSFNEQKTLELSIGLENQMHLNALVESGSQENLVQVSELNPVIGDQVGSTSVAANGEANAEVGLFIDDSGTLTIGDKVSHHEQESGSISRLATKLFEPSPISVFDSSFQEDITSPMKFTISEDSKLKPRRLLFGGLDSLGDQHYESSMDSPAVAESRADLKKVELPSKHLDSDFLHVQVDTKDKAEFNYVRDILELSGFIRNEILGTWHSADQPVDPSVYEEVEGCLPHEHECSENEDGGYSNHLLLFDLINEVLMEIYERSFNYYPRPLSSFSHIRPLPAGYHVLEEVWATMSWYLSSRPELDRSLDYVVSRDLAKGDGWLNLQFDIECVGLGLEDSIFDDILEEVIWT